ncbi:hypothetical protein A2533_04785 [Candidatus Falkowbacteria bacterium RIFOXYD2_FULL_35_9]|uniref:Uncharacterized protein n=1 Tax=Candidatus Falkowbacteria bacterium RIFOXYC2_FULL_36_12 TaxID=1798002 RepID=A0A1F5SZP8_9BACT|nr:MAG: hypothetical protein A2300_02425 [Candidatus Falkowbacteria bacterium RIFOXYB2_FULL_35_7]OGF31691.1 MAG: hypothetical protein A2478_04350 [Candidatus Falkowbacteria bacterium RIFOXYC2_FULL_36_12]OGF33182.1 MAG: hypothetical protein A2223_04940 [Candidatus Falkowbacteria bacterium RIFOXYA2_FULL_35_8]OGF46171.1 MAG: hypothetical protein A2533_04785 [Candidatus Falkowbacteria bacterium RIFOXYD2_FULL_35_9]
MSKSKMLFSQSLLALTLMYFFSKEIIPAWLINNILWHQMVNLLSGNTINAFVWFPISLALSLTCSLVIFKLTLPNLPTAKENKK